MILNIFLLLPLLNYTHAGIAIRQQVQESANGDVYVSQIGSPATYQTSVPTPTSSASSLRLQASPSISSTSPNTITPVPGSTGSGTSSNYWPASVTYVSQLGGRSAVVIGFTTTGVNGVPTFTSIIPSQSFLSATAEASTIGEVVVSITNTNTSTTIEVSNIPVASTFSDVSTIQIETAGGTTIVYSPTTLPGYSNNQPIEISTSFVETVNGQTTTQSGWWLIGPYGYIDPPHNRPWGNGLGGSNCIAGPSICNTPCGVVAVGGNWFIHLPSTKCPSGETGPPGWPGGPIVTGSNGPGDTLPPYPGNPGDTGGEDPDNCDEDGAGCSTSITSSTARSSSEMSSELASKTTYVVVAAATAVQSLVIQELQNISAKFDGSYQPDVGPTEFTNGAWIVNLTAPEASSLSSQSTLALVMESDSATVPDPDPSLGPASMDATVTFVTFSQGSTSPAKLRRLAPDQELKSSYARHLMEKDTARNLADTSQDIDRRDVGTDLVRQLESPKDLSVIAWKQNVVPPILSVDEVDYVFEESSGEFTWVYLVDADGVDDSNVEFKFNFDDDDTINIDPHWVFAPGMSQARTYTDIHGTCLASKICGRGNGASKRTIVIPVVFTQSRMSFLLVIMDLVQDIKNRQGRGQAMPGKTVVAIAYDVVDGHDEYTKLMRDEIRNIMNMGVVVVVAAGNKVLPTDPFVTLQIPTAFALEPNFPLIRVGNVDTSGSLAPRSQQGDIYLVGVWTWFVLLQSPLSLCSSTSGAPRHCLGAPVLPPKGERLTKRNTTGAPRLVLQTS